MLALQQFLSVYEQSLTTFVLYYLGVGLIFAVIFAFGLVRIIDTRSRDASFGFRIMILPGATLLWPLVLLAWLLKSFALLVRAT